MQLICASKASSKPASSVASVSANSSAQVSWCSCSGFSLLRSVCGLMPVTSPNVDFNTCAGLVAFAVNRQTTIADHVTSTAHRSPGDTAVLINRQVRRGDGDGDGDGDVRTHKAISCFQLNSAKFIEIRKLQKTGARLLRNFLMHQYH